MPRKTLYKWDISLLYQKIEHYQSLYINNLSAKSYTVQYVAECTLLSFICLVYQAVP